MLPQGSRLHNTRAYDYSRCSQVTSQANEAHYRVYYYKPRETLTRGPEYYLLSEGEEKKKEFHSYLPTYLLFPSVFLEGIYRTLLPMTGYILIRRTPARNDANSLSLSLSFFYVVINGLGCLVGDFRRGTCPRQRLGGRRYTRRLCDILIY